MVLLVVLGIFIAFITAVVMTTMPGPRGVAIKFEVDSLSLALYNYKNEFGEFPPDYSDVHVVGAHIRRRWPDINSAELRTMRDLGLTRAQALTFWLRGFADSATNPNTAPGQRLPLYDFDKSRLLDPTTGKLPIQITVNPVYLPTDGGRAVDGSLRPYIYFDAQTYATATYVAPSGIKRPYRSDNSTEIYAAFDSFQLIHAGLDEDYGQVNVTSNHASYTFRLELRARRF